MKKAILSGFALLALGFALSSCGPKLMTEAEMEAAIEKGFEEGRAAVEEEMNAKCDAEFEQRVETELARLRAEDAVQ